ncbi:uncharacterized protein TRIVIDRAFT_60696 [Trichoderma virens Gv29-8]|uniref:Uncharacterized protein n=1 Tax=Hypocrea virens (strain Gv29-8 / FGSC 10586) TaxID=413071 RepID=G9MTU6_HYPVG|nr:uncharacterized protein TRIVIDRAFT_60696 [Trichoderma virens Gv29-8]EHK22445.1 hypothetical protein TRIVIDRAFT_60696 [Trichoderma virens Gv29-8]UKZ47488.1 hypothetical protein TrVGV298_001706 [Trichoderma virens]
MRLAGWLGGERKGWRGGWLTATAADNEGQPATLKPGSKRLKTRGWWDERAEDGKRDWREGVGGDSVCTATRDDRQGVQQVLYLVRAISGRGRNIEVSMPSLTALAVIQQPGLLQYRGPPFRAPGAPCSPTMEP